MQNAVLWLTLAVVMPSTCATPRMSCVPFATGALDPDAAYTIELPRRLRLSVHGETAQKMRVGRPDQRVWHIFVAPVEREDVDFMWVAVARGADSRALFVGPGARIGARESLALDRSSLRFVTNQIDYERMIALKFGRRSPTPLKDLYAPIAFGYVYTTVSAALGPDGPAGAEQLSSVSMVGEACVPL